MHAMADGLSGCLAAGRPVLHARSPPHMSHERWRLFLFINVHVAHAHPPVLASSSGYSSVAVTLAYRLTELASGMGGDMEDDGDEDGAMELYLDKYSFWGPYMSWFWNCYPYCN